MDDPTQNSARDEIVQGCSVAISRLLWAYEGLCKAGVEARRAEPIISVGMQELINMVRERAGTILYDANSG